MKPILVRRGVTESLKAQGKNPDYRIEIDRSAKRVFAREKFSETSSELEQALKSHDKAEILKNLAKVSESLLLIGKEHGITSKQVREVRTHHKEVLGSYSDFVILHEIDRH